MAHDAPKEMGEVVDLFRKATRADAEVEVRPAATVEPLEGEVVEGEVVQAGVPVDGPAARPGGAWIADRRARLDATPDLIPPYLRDRDEFTEAASFVARYYAHMGAYHATRSPVYLLRLVGRAPRGTARLTVRWFHWVTDAQAAGVVARAAAGKDDAAWTTLVTAQTKRTAARRKQTLVVSVPVAVLVALAAVLLPGWTLAAGATGIAALLGVFGRDPDKPIVHRYVSVHLQRRLESPEVEAALKAIGIKGDVDWVAPIAVDGPGWKAELDLPPGELAEKVLEDRPKLAGAMRRPLPCVWPGVDNDAHPSRLVLWIARQDPTKAKRRIWPLMHRGQVDLFADIPFGYSPRGELVPLRLIGTNMLIGGVMGSGKTSAVLVIVLAGALDPTCELWVYELKGSGDVDAVKPVCHRYVSGDDDEHCKAALDALKALEKELKRRKKVVADLPVADVPQGRKVYPHLAARKNLGLHPILAIFDECHTLFEHPKYGKAAAEVAGRLIRKARAYAITIVFTTQRPDAASIPRGVSDNAITRFCLAVSGHVANNLVLGTGAYKRGYRATMFDPEKDAGTGWLSRSALSAQIVRAAFIEQEEAFAIGRRALALRTAAGTLTGQAAGEEVEHVDDSDIIDHLYAIWPPGEDAMHSYRLVESLAIWRPDVYAEWMATDRPAGDMDDAELREVRTARSTLLSNALKPYGVKTLQIHRRGDGGGGKGVRFEDLPDRSDTDEDDLEDEAEEG